MEKELYGLWGKMKRVDKVFKVVWIGPMSREDMKYRYPEYRHNFKPVEACKR